MGCALLSSPKSLKSLKLQVLKKSEQLWEYIYTYSNYVQMW